MNRGVNAALIKVVAVKKAQSAGMTGLRPTQLRRTGQNRHRRRRRLGDKTEGSTMAKVLAGANERTATEAPQQPVKDLYEVGEIPPLGHVPPRMHAWVIRRERHGEPEQAMQAEVDDTPRLESHDELVMVMAAGVDYNGVGAGLGLPISPFDVHKAPYHIAGSDAAGVVWAVRSDER